MSTILQILPLAFVMIAGPQILSAIFFATTEQWRLNTAAYVLGAALSISIVVTLAFLLSSGASNAGIADDTIYYVILALLLYAMVHAYRTRKTAEPPKWMGKLQTASPRFCFVLGFLLLGVFPSDLIVSISVGSHLSVQDDALVVLPHLPRTHPAVPGSAEPPGSDHGQAWGGVPSKGA